MMLCCALTGDLLVRLEVILSGLVVDRAEPCRA
jgi:hypothetical protein